MFQKLNRIKASLIRLNQRAETELKPSDWDSWLPKAWAIIRETQKLTEQWICEYKKTFQTKQGIIELIAEGIIRDLNSTQKKIFLMVGDRCRGSRFKRCFEFKKNIAKACGVSRRTVFNELKNLESRLLIVRIKERPAGCRYRKSIIALRTELSESVYDILLREQRNAERKAERKARRQRAKAETKEIENEIDLEFGAIYKSAQPVSEQLPEPVLTRKEKEILNMITYLGEEYDIIQAQREQGKGWITKHKAEPSPILTELEQSPFGYKIQLADFYYSLEIQKQNCRAVDDWLNAVFNLTA